MQETQSQKLKEWKHSDSAAGHKIIKCNWHNILAMEITKDEVSYHDQILVLAVLPYKFLCLRWIKRYLVWLKSQPVNLPENIAHSPTSLLVYHVLLVLMWNSVFKTSHLFDYIMSSSCSDYKQSACNN